MTVTHTLKVPTPVAEGMNIYALTDGQKALLSLVDSEINGSVRTATYVYSGGSASDPVEVTARHQYNERRNQTNCSLRVSAEINTEDDVKNTEVRTPVEAVIAWNYDGEYLPDVGKMVTLLQIAAEAILVPSANYATNGIVDKFNHKIVADLF
jgi:hypothetical protein